MDSIDLSTYGGLSHPAGFPGQILTSNPTTIISMVNTGTSPIAFGAAVMFSTPNMTCKAVENTVNNNDIAGIACFSPVGVTDSTVSGFKTGDCVPVMKSGFLWVITGMAVQAGESALLLPTGKFGSRYPNMPNPWVTFSDERVVWQTSAAAGELAILRVTM